MRLRKSSMNYKKKKQVLNQKLISYSNNFYRGFFWNLTFISTIFERKLVLFSIIFFFFINIHWSLICYLELNCIKGTIDAKEHKLFEVKHKMRTIAILQRMKSCISSSLLRIAGWILYKLLSRMLTTIQFHKGINE
jgi:hypothetical protein